MSSTVYPLTSLDEGGIRHWAFRARSALATHRDLLDSLNVFPVPDGDTGTNMYLTLHTALESLIGIYLAGGSTKIVEGTQALARSTLLSARGNSGVILSQLVRGLADVVTDAALAARDRVGDLRGSAEAARVDGLDGPMLAHVLRAAADRAWKGVANPVEGTILTVAQAAADAAQAAVARDPALCVVTGAALDGARAALAATPRLLPSLAAAGVVDAGGAGLLVILRALHEVVTGRSAGDLNLSAPLTGPPRTALAPSPPPAATAYEVMYLIEGCPDLEADRLRADLTHLGDSVLVVGDTDLRTVHAHVNDAGAAIEAGLGRGRLYGLRVSWLAAEPWHGAACVADGSAEPTPSPMAAAARPAGPPLPAPPPVGRSARVGVVACADAPGLATMLAQSGAQVVTSGPGDRATPAAILAAVKATGASSAVILPNDHDAVLAALTAVELSAGEGVDARVVPTAWLVEGLAALAVHQEGLGVGVVCARMAEAAAQVRAGMVVTAGRQAHTAAGRCEPGDVLGYCGSEAVVIGADLVAVAVDVVRRLARDRAELVTLVDGQDAPGLAARVAEALATEHPDWDVVALHGGQASYPLLIGVE